MRQSCVKPVPICSPQCTANRTAGMSSGTRCLSADCARLTPPRPGALLAVLRPSLACIRSPRRVRSHSSEQHRDCTRCSWSAPLPFQVPIRDAALARSFGRVTRRATQHTGQKRAAHAMHSNETTAGDRSTRRARCTSRDCARSEARFAGRVSGLDNADSDRRRTMTPRNESNSNNANEH